VSVALAAVLEQVKAELASAAAYAAAAGLELDASQLSELSPVLLVTFRNQKNEPFVVEMDCRDFPMYPPTIEFLDPSRERRATRDLYPNCFHPMPCICARYNRKAYGSHGGPHGDWRLIDWQLPTGNGVAIDSVAMILSDLHSKIRETAGRLG